MEEEEKDKQSEKERKIKWIIKVVIQGILVIVLLDFIGLSPSDMLHTFSKIPEMLSDIPKIADGSYESKTKIAEKEALEVAAKEAASAPVVKATTKPKEKRWHTLYLFNGVNGKTEPFTYKGEKLRVRFNFKPHYRYYNGYEESGTLAFYIVPKGEDIYGHSCFEFRKEIKTEYDFSYLEKGDYYLYIGVSGGICGLTVEELR